MKRCPICRAPLEPSKYRLTYQCNKSHVGLPPAEPEFTVSFWALVACVVLTIVVTAIAYFGTKP